MSDDVRLAAALDAHLDRVQERIRTVHERQSCPKCGVPVGELCISMGSFHGPKRTKHPHTERLRADGIALR